MGTLHCALENGADLYVNERPKIRHYRLGLLKKEEDEERRMPNSDFFTSRGANVNLRYIAIFYFARCKRKLALYSDVIHSFDWKSAVELDGGV